MTIPAQERNPRQTCDTDGCHAWATKQSDRTRCQNCGGASTGPKDTSHLEGNSFAKDNPGGGAPKLNTNASKSGAWEDWQKAYQRFDSETREYVDRMIADMRSVAKEHAPDVDPERRGKLLKEKATLSILWRRANLDQLERGLIIEKETESGTTVDVNPTLERGVNISSRQRKIAEELCLWPGYQEDEESTITDILEDDD